MFGLPDNAAIIRFGDVLEKRGQSKRKATLLLDMSVTQTLTGYWMVCERVGLHAGVQCPRRDGGDTGRMWKVYAVTPVQTAQ